MAAHSAGAQNFREKRVDGYVASWKAAADENRIRDIVEVNIYRSRLQAQIIFALLVCIFAHAARTYRFAPRIFVTITADHFAAICICNCKLII